MCCNKWLYQVQRQSRSIWSSAEVRLESPQKAHHLLPWLHRRHSQLRNLELSFGWGRDGPLPQPDFQFWCHAAVGALFGSQLTRLSLIGGRRGLELGAWLAALPRLATVHVWADPLIIRKDFSCLTTLTSASLILSGLDHHGKNNEASLPGSLRQLCATFEGMDWLPEVVEQASGLEKLVLGEFLAQFEGLEQLTNLTSLSLKSDVNGVPQELGALSALRHLDFELKKIRSEEELAPLLQLTGVRCALLCTGLPLGWPCSPCGDP